MSTFYFRVPAGVTHKAFVKKANQYSIRFYVMHNVGDAFIFNVSSSQEIADALAAATKCKYRTQEEVNHSIRTRAINNSYQYTEL